MVYEYCDEIKNSGINMNAFPDSCTSFLEMGLYIAESTIREVDNIFHEAGLVELDKFKNNALTEANEEGIAKKVGKAIIGALTKAWEGLKAAWKKLTDLVAKKIDEFNKRIGDRFEKLDLSKYKKSINKALKDNDLTIINLDKTAEFEKDLGDAAEKVLDDILANKDNINTSFDNMFAAIIDKMTAGSVPIEGVDDAVKFVTQTMRKETYKDADASTVITYKKDIIDIKKKAKSTVNNSYSEAKKAIDYAMKQLKKAEKENAIMDKYIIKCEIAYQTMLLKGVSQTVKDALNSAISIAICCIRACRPGKEDDKINHESVKFDTNFVNQAFNS